MRLGKIGLMGILGLLALSELALAALVFESKSKDVDVGAEQTRVEVIYSFENKGEEDQVIEKVHSACPLCLSAGVRGGTQTPNGIVIKPGERGEVKAAFKVGAFTGKVEKVIKLYMKGDADGEPSLHLKCNLTVPIVVSVEPSTLTWKQGSTERKKVVIKVAEGHSIEVERVSLRSDDFVTELKTVQEGRHYECFVTPKAGAEPQMRPCSLYTNAKKTALMRLRAYLKIEK